MIYDSTTYPASPATDSSVLFRSLGYFWQRMFKDKLAVQGLTISQAEAAIQSYTELFDMVGTYSSRDIPVLETRNWYPLYIYRSSLNNNYLLFGEGVKFGDTVDSAPYIFGAAIPEEPDVYSMIVPAELKEISIATTQLISPKYAWVSGQDMELRNERLFFYENPFSKPGVTPVNIYNDNGTPKLLDDGSTQDQLIVLWFYKAKIDADYLQENFGYLFGVNVPHTEEGKQILHNSVSLFTKGPNVNGIKAFCLASLGLPVIRTTGTLQLIQTGEVYNTLITSTGVYNYPIAYELKNLTPGQVIEAGYIPINVLEFYDSLIDPAWWVEALQVSLPNPGGVPTIDITVNLPLVLPPTLMLVSDKENLVFINSQEPVSLDLNGILTFPVTGNAQDVAAFQTRANTIEFIMAVNEYLVAHNNSSLTLGSGSLLNPVDFIFKYFLGTVSSILKITFLDINTVGSFQQSFQAIKSTLPPNTLLMVICDVRALTEIYDLTALATDSVATLINGQQPNDDVGFNTTLAPGLSINDMGLSRVIVSNLNSEDYRNISLVKPS